MRHAQLSSIELPDFGEPTIEPLLDREIYARRHIQLVARMTANALDALVIYGDREHSANISWATGFDPRFEEAIYIAVPGSTPTLLAGNECLPYSETASGSFKRVLWQPLSLMGQPRGQYRELAEIFREAGLTQGMRIGLAGWKGFENEAGEFDPYWFETPHYLVEALAQFGPVTNAALAFMHPGNGLRVINEANQLARFEYAATLTSNAVRRFIQGAKPGMTEYEACLNLGFNGFPQSVHLNMSSGPRAKYGLPSPSMRVIEPGDPIVIGAGLMGALNCRAGFMVGGAKELPAGIADYVEKLVRPYFEAAAAWYETIGIGVEGGAIYDAVMSRLGDPFFGVGLNPGHLIHLDEWVHSPIRQYGDIRLASGMALQCDIIPATGTAYFTSNIEDGIALADDALRSEIRGKYPECWQRIERRRAFMARELGIKLKPEVLPFSNIPAWLPPFWLAPEKIMSMR